MISNLSEKTDEDLMDSYLGGSQESFRLISLRWSTRLSKFIGRKIYRPELTEELVQETLLNVHRGRSTWVRGDYKFSTWIMTIAKNVVISSGRSKRARTEVLWIEDKSEEEETLAEDPVTRILLMKCVASLPEHLSEAFKLTYLDGMDHREAAIAAGISPDNMRARASRARSALREMVG